MSLFWVCRTAAHFVGQVEPCHDKRNISVVRFEILDHPSNAHAQQLNTVRDDSLSETPS